MNTHGCKKVITIMTQILHFVRQKYTVGLDKMMHCGKVVYAIREGMVTEMWIVLSFK